MIISDTSPIVSLAMINRADLLARIYHAVFIAPAVYNEIIAGVGHAGAEEVVGWDWIKVHRVSQTEVFRVLRVNLDDGEAESIALALELAPQELLLDERKARRMALKLDLPVAGTLDVLMAAKRAGLIPTVRPVIDDLLQHAHFRVSRSLYHKLLSSANEEQASYSWS